MNVYLTDFSEHVQPDLAIGPVVSHTSRSSKLYRNGLKRALDLVLVILSAPFVVPVVLFMAVLVALDGYHPFFTQTRVGRNGKEFRIWKMRSMVPNADRALEMYLSRHPKAREEWDRSQKLKNDPRITRIGRLLRKTSLDELPQLLNVLNGTMSMVGPRPIMVEQKALYSGQAYYSLRPGITGMWQVTDRNESDFSSRAPFDEQYGRSVSFGTDVNLLLRTVAVVLRGTGY